MRNKNVSSTIPTHKKVMGFFTGIISFACFYLHTLGF